MSNELLNNLNEWIKIYDGFIYSKRYNQAVSISTIESFEVEDKVIYCYFKQPSSFKSFGLCKEKDCSLEQLLTLIEANKEV